MRKKFTIFLILIFGFGSINFNQYIEASSIAHFCQPDEWECGEWSTCSPEGTQTRTCNNINCEIGGSFLPPEISQSCVPECMEDIWDCSEWAECKFNPAWMHDDTNNGLRTRTCTKTFDCPISEGTPEISQGCTPMPVITSISPSVIYAGTKVTINGYNFGLRGLYSWETYCPKCQVKINNSNYVSNTFWGLNGYDWSNANINFILLPNNNVSSGYITIVDKNGNESNKFNFTLTPKILSCTQNDWSCGGWSSCSSYNTQTRTCSKISSCNGGISSPATTQSCTYTPACSADTWECDNWGTCSPQGVQTRSCSKTYDCQSAETAAPATSQYCESSYQQNYQTPSAGSDIVTNQNAIIKSTVKLICPVSETMASQGSGSVINSTGLILTNKHVIDGTAGCWVGFIDDYDDEPYFGDRQIADIYKVSSDADVAVLKLRNPSNKILTSVNISQSNSSNIQLGEILTTYGYPAKFGTKITYTSGDFSGVDGDYLKTTAIIEHGNSGGGAYLKNGTFIGIPTAVIKGSLNSMGYLLSINKINSWLNNSVAYNYNSNNNNYSRVSAMLEDMDLGSLNSLGLYITGDEENIKTESKSNNVVTEEKSLITTIDNVLSSRLSGKILLQVEKNGEGWYIYPDNKKKYYLGRPADAFSIMRSLGLGISENSYNSFSGYAPSRLSGKILLRVEVNGEAYYVNPDNLKMYYLGRPDDAFQIMREQGLGITNTDIRKIDVGEIN